MSSILRGLQFNQRGYNSKPQDPVFTTPSGEQLALYKSTVVNGTGGNIGMGILRSINEAKLEMKQGTVGAGTTALFDGSQAKQQAPFAAFGAGNDLFVGSENKFNLIGLLLGTDIVAVTTYQFFDGTAFVDLTTIEDFGVAIDEPYDYVTFLAPHNWEKGGPVLATLPGTRFWIKLSNASTDTVDKVLTAEMLVFRASVAPNAGLSIEAPSETKPFHLEEGEGLIPYFTTTGPANFIESTYNITK